MREKLSSYADKSPARYGYARQRIEADIRKSRPTRLQYIALEDFDLSFYPGEVDGIVDGWERGKPLGELAEQLDRPVEEIMVLLIDLSYHGRIQRRLGGLKWRPPK